jgi:hypothetical protein
MPPLEVECKSLWQPRNVAPRMDPIAVSRELEIGNAAPKRLLLGHRAALFIRRVAREFRAAAQMVRKRLKTRGRNLNIVVNGREDAARERSWLTLLIR